MNRVGIVGNCASGKRLLATKISKTAQEKVTRRSLKACSAASIPTIKQGVAVCHLTSEKTTLPSIFL